MIIFYLESMNNNNSFSSRARRPARQPTLLLLLLPDPGLVGVVWKPPRNLTSLNSLSRALCVCASARSAKVHISHSKPAQWSRTFDTLPVIYFGECELLFAAIYEPVDSLHAAQPPNVQACK